MKDESKFFMKIKCLNKPSKCKKKKKAKEKKV